MLPDYPDIKKTVLENLIGNSRLQAERDPLLAMMPRFVAHEGSRAIVRREDGSDVELDYRQSPLRASVTVSAEEMRVGGPHVTASAVARLREDLDLGLAKRTIATIEEAAESVGNTVKATGPFTCEIYFELLEKMELSFHQDGSWAGVKLLAHPDTAKLADPVLDSIEREPDLRARRDAIVARKREEWRVREAARKLVD